MKIKHFLLLILTLGLVAFCQPLVQLLGGVVLIGAVVAYIYSDLPAEKQALWDMKVAQRLQQVRLALRKPAALTKKPVSTDVQALPESTSTRLLKARRTDPALLEETVDPAWPVAEKARRRAQPPQAPSDQAK